MSTLRPPNADVFAAVIQAEVLLWNRLEKDLRATENATSLARYLVLRQIHHGQDSGGFRVQDIARAQHCTISAASRHLDRLEKDGLITRTACTDDRRALRLHLTEDGLQRMRAAQATFEATLSSLLNRFDDQSLHHLVTLLTSLAHTIDPEHTKESTS
ncbi:MAG: MarR family transcriptional regulator [Actinomycetaceae bacterium]|nr:MarR family transcriptional regulator [Actinomycetaceae bacterium]